MKGIFAIILVLFLLQGCTNSAGKEYLDSAEYKVVGTIVNKFEHNNSYFITLAPSNIDHTTPITVYIETQAIYDSLELNKEYEFNLVLDINLEANRFEVSYSSYN